MGATSRQARQFFALLVLVAGAASAQDFEPRAYSRSPVGTNFLLLGWGHSSGGVLVDPTLPITDVQATIDAPLIGYSHTFDVAGRAASIAIAVPYVWLEASGNVGQEERQASRSGLGDPRVRLAVNLIGDAALRPDEFAQQPPTTTLGISLTIIAPAGKY